MDQFCVLPVGWNWHTMYLLLVHTEIRPYHGHAFTSMPSGIVEVQNHSLGGHFPKSAFALWREEIDNCIFFSQFLLIVLIMPHSTPIGIRHEMLALAHGVMWQIVLLVSGSYSWRLATINHIMQSHAATRQLMSGKSTGLLGRPHLVKNMLC